MLFKIIWNLIKKREFQNFVKDFKVSVNHGPNFVGEKHDEESAGLLNLKNLVREFWSLQIDRWNLVRYLKTAGFPSEKQQNQ